MLVVICGFLLYVVVQVIFLVAKLFFETGELIIWESDKIA